jgi:DNA-binding winged helix-turn-helix (wHTH) protein/Flp pilus assembly protein TadD
MTGPRQGFGPFSLDVPARVLYRDDEVEHISPKTVDVLIALLERQGEVVTKEELMRKVWPDTVVEEGNLSVHVSLLRKTLGDAAPIETVAKRGYRLNVAAARPPAENEAAREATLRGRYFWNKLTRGALERARACFEDAMRADPGMGEAEAGLADTLVMVGLFGFDLSREVFAAALSHARGAVERSPRSADAQASFGFALLFQSWDFEAGARALAEARRLAPARVEPHLWAALLHALRGEYAAALAGLNAAREIDPLSLKAGVGAGFHLYLAQQHRPEVEPLLRVLDLEPDLAIAHWALGLAYDRLSQFARAEAAHRRAIELSGDSPTMRSNLARSLALAGRTAEADVLLADLRAAGLGPYRLATVEAALGRAELALEGLERALETRDPWLVCVRVDPMLDPLRGQPRFRDVEAAVLGGGGRLP